MLTISERTEQAMARGQARPFVQQLVAWLKTQPGLAHAHHAITEDWASNEIEVAHENGIESEDAVARFARLRLRQPREWFDLPEAREITGSRRDGDLKVFQLECLAEGIVDDEPDLQVRQEGSINA